jgi:hypothetical protein
MQDVRLYAPFHFLSARFNDEARFVCSMSQQTSDIVIFPSYYSRTWEMSMFDRVRIWEAARATSAATSFFEPLVIDGKAFVDGATGANNPIYQLWAEATSIYRPCDGWKLEDDLKCVVLIGTGIPSSKPFGPGIGGVAKTLMAIATAAENTAEQFQRQHPSCQEGDFLPIQCHAGTRGNWFRGGEPVGRY